MKETAQRNGNDATIMDLLRDQIKPIGKFFLSKEQRDLLTLIRVCVLAVFASLPINSIPASNIKKSWIVWAIRQDIHDRNGEIKSAQMIYS